MTPSPNTHSRLNSDATVGTGDQADSLPALAVVFDNGLILLSHNATDDVSIIVDSGLTTCVSFAWSPLGGVFAVAGTEAGVDGSNEFFSFFLTGMTNVVKLFDLVTICRYGGGLVPASHTLRVPATSLASITWEGGLGTKLACAVDSHLFFASAKTK
jgi:hypothetical protein